MGCCATVPQENNDIAKQLATEKKKDLSVKKILFLGTGGSGKSTFFKYLRAIHGSGFGDADRMRFKGHILAQIIEQMKLVVECIDCISHEDTDHLQVDEDGYDIGDGVYVATLEDMKLNEEAQRAAHVLQLVKDMKLTDEIADAIQILWETKPVKKIYEARSVMKIETSSKYFWDSIDRINQNDYIPDENDIYLVRYRTTGVIDQKFYIKKNLYHIFDVGGQKSERKKWIHCYENVTAVLFIVALDGYNECMYEDESMNCMVDSLNLFENICNNKWFEKTTMILLLNKKDLFANEIMRAPITVCPAFENYNGNPKSFDETTAYIKDVFMEKNHNPGNKSIFVHLCCATDQNNVEKVFNDIQHIIIENSMQSVGLMYADVHTGLL